MRRIIFATRDPGGTCVRLRERAAHHTRQVRAIPASTSESEAPRPAPTAT